MKRAARRAGYRSSAGGCSWAPTIAASLAGPQAQLAPAAKPNPKKPAALRIWRRLRKMASGVARCSGIRQGRWKMIFATAVGLDPLHVESGHSTDLVKRPQPPTE